MNKMRQNKLWEKINSSLNIIFGTVDSFCYNIKKSLNGDKPVFNIFKSLID